MRRPSDKIQGAQNEMTLALILPEGIKNAKECKSGSV